MIPKSCTALALSVLLGQGTVAFAQVAAERVASHSDWSVFVAGTPKECYIVSQPKSSSAKRDGQNVEVDRGDIRIFVTFRPAENVSGEVSFSSGYPFRAGNAVKLRIGTDEFLLNPGSGEANGWAWPESAAVDSRVGTAMKKGSTATVTGVSARGTTTVDTFSLSGFTAAYNDAEQRCK